MMKEKLHTLFPILYVDVFIQSLHCSSECIGRSYLGQSQLCYLFNYLLISSSWHVGWQYIMEASEPQHKHSREHLPNPDPDHFPVCCHLIPWKTLYLLMKSWYFLTPSGDFSNLFMPFKFLYFRSRTSLCLFLTAVYYATWFTITIQACCLCLKLNRRQHSHTSMNVKTNKKTAIIVLI